MIDIPPITNWVWLFSGFKESLLAPSGCEAVWRRLRHFSRAAVCIQFREWNTEPKAIAQFIVRNSMPLPEMPRPRIVIGGYSWGGDLAIDLCIELNRLGLEVEELVTADAVYRSGVFSSRFTINPLSMTPWPRFEIPMNVKQVTAFGQANDLPRGHRIFQGGVEIPRTMLGCGHGAIDECVEFSDAMVAAAGRL